MNGHNSARNKDRVTTFILCTLSDNAIYNIFDAIFSIFDGNKNGILREKIFLSDEEIIPFEYFNAP